MPTPDALPWEQQYTDPIYSGRAQKDMPYLVPAAHARALYELCEMAKEINHDSLQPGLVCRRAEKLWHEIFEAPNEKA